MNKLFTTITSALLLTLPGLAHAGMFTEQEITNHRNHIETVTQTAATCLEETWQDHLQFFKKWHVSKYYGNRKPEHSTQQLRKEQLKKYGAPESLESQLEPISCIGLTIRCLGQGFKAAGQASTWAKINAALAVDNNFYGTDLQKMLHELGWKSYYWNPDPSQNEAWDNDDQLLNPLLPGKKWNAVWGGHAYRYSRAINKHEYYGIPLDDVQTLVGFKTEVPESFRAAPFFVGTAHSGYHVFPGKVGQVIEAHSMRNLNSIDNLQVSPFNPLETGGGPRWTRSEKYRSGVIVVPPPKY